MLHIIYVFGAAGCGNRNVETKLGPTASSHLVSMLHSHREFPGGEQGLLGQNGPVEITGIALRTGPVGQTGLVSQPGLVRPNRACLASYIPPLRANGRSTKMWLSDAQVNCASNAITLVASMAHMCKSSTFGISMHASGPRAPRV